ncbi:helix-turn-helix domain-containing protein [Onishia niordana]|uniref:helix-turn-helix domain-containing protein n=1 Tax=Onishia niordana TaxID=2508711 RepID=UPI0010A01B07|nr:helix-turn-helix domain-containing protein [Halomonas niordiana]
MDIKLHKKATTTPGIRAAIQAAPDSVTHRELAERFGVSISTIRRWRFREEVHDRSHTRHNLRTSLSPAQEMLLMVARDYLHLGLDDLLKVAQAFLAPHLSRSSLQRLIKRQNAPYLENLSRKGRNMQKPPKMNAPGMVHIAVEVLPEPVTQPEERCLYLAIDRASRWVYLETLPSSSARDASRFLQNVVDQAPFTINRVMTCVSETFTAQTKGSSSANDAADQHPFDQACAHEGIHHGLEKAAHYRHGHTDSGRIERLDEVLHLPEAEQSEKEAEAITSLLENLTRHYNHCLPQRGLSHRTPADVLREWRASRSETS